MTRARFGLKALGLCLIAVLGTAALMASGAQGEWLVENNTFEKSVKVSAHTAIALTVPSKLLEISCTAVAAGAGSKIETTPSKLNYALALLNFTNCQTISNHGVSAGCKPVEPVVSKAQGDLFLHNGKEYLLLTPDDPVNNRFARIDFPAATCALPDTNITGSLAFECLTASLTAGDCLTNEVNHRVSAASAALFPGHGLLYGGNPAPLTGIANVELTSGEAWSGHV